MHDTWDVLLTVQWPLHVARPRSFSSVLWRGRTLPNLPARYPTPIPMSYCCKAFIYRFTHWKYIVNLQLPIICHFLNLFPVALCIFIHCNCAPVCVVSLSHSLWFPPPYDPAVLCCFKEYADDDSVSVAVAAIKTLLTLIQRSSGAEHF